VAAPVGWVDTPSPSRDAFARGLLRFHPLKERGRREDRVHAAPAVSCAICAQEDAHEHTGSAEASGLPCAVALRLTSCSSRRTAFLPPSPLRSLLLKNLTPAPRRQNHTTSPYASCQPRQSWLPRPPHPTARFVTIASRPSCRVGRRINELICVRTKGEYFCAGYWTKWWRDLPGRKHRHW
jgi:hypothetical protein